MDKSNSKPMLTMFLTGLLAGTVITALYTPKSGRETREDIKDHIDKTQKDIIDKKDTMKDELKHQSDEVRKVVANKIDTSK